MSTLTVGMADAKTNFSRLTADANKTGKTITVFRNSKPWVEIRPLAIDETVDVLPKETREALADIEAIKSDPDHERFHTAESFFKSLGM